MRHNKTYALMMVVRTLSLPIFFLRARRASLSAALACWSGGSSLSFSLSLALFSAFFCCAASCLCAWAALASSSAALVLFLSALALAYTHGCCVEIVMSSSQNE